MRQNDVSTPTATAPVSSDSFQLTDEDLSRLNTSRANTYALLSRLYRKEVDDALLDDLLQTKFPVETGSKSADKGYFLLSKYLSNVWENTLEELSRDYSDCFIGKGMDSFSAAYPYESVYTSEKRLLMQDARDEVLAIIRSEGLDKNADWKETEDHIALELEFMQILARRTADACLSGQHDQASNLLETQARFFDDHLASWIPTFVIDLKRHARTDFYQGLAYLTEGFLEVEKECMEALTDPGVQPS